MKYVKELEFAKDLAKQAGEIMLEHFHGDSKATIWKDDHTELTIADTNINDLVISNVKTKFAEDGVIGEEGDYKPSRKRVWVCDPIDGTFPYSRGIPVSSFNLALVEDGEPVVCVVYDPFMKRLFHAVKGEGAYINNVKMELVDQEKGRYGLSVEVWANKDSSVFADHEVVLRVHEALAKKSYLQIYHCSVAYTAALVAKGDLDGVVFSGRNPWDAAAVSLLIKEAGGIFTDIHGKEQKYNQSIGGFIGAPPDQYKRIVKTIEPIINKYAQR